MRWYIQVHVRSVMDTADELEGLVLCSQRKHLLRLQPMHYFPFISELFQHTLAIFLQHLMTTDGLRDETTPTRYTEACSCV